MKYICLALLVLVVSAQDWSCKKDGEDKGDDAVCDQYNITGGAVCCYYSRLESVETWTCSLVPSEAD